jgi:hypothetical protein
MQQRWQVCVASGGRHLRLRGPHFFRSCTKGNAERAGPSPDRTGAARSSIGRWTHASTAARDPVLSEGGRRWATRLFSYSGSRCGVLADVGDCGVAQGQSGNEPWRTRRSAVPASGMHSMETSPRGRANSRWTSRYPCPFRRHDPDSETVAPVARPASSFARTRPCWFFCPGVMVSLAAGKVTARSCIDPLCPHSRDIRHRKSLPDDWLRDSGMAFFAVGLVLAAHVFCRERSS